MHHGALGHIAREVHRDDRVIRVVRLADIGLLGVVGQIGLGDIDLLAHILQRLFFIEVRLELKDDIGEAFGGGRVVILQALNGLEAQLQRLDEQALGVFGRDAGIGD